jgi:hypothetical protein
MRCSKARKLISESVDGSVEARKAASLERHLEACPACREVLEDFRAMKSAASNLDTPEPGEAVWLRIKDRVASGGPAAETSAPVSVSGRFAFGLSGPALRFASAAALVLVLIASGVVIGLRLAGRGAAFYPRNSEKYTLAKLDEAEAYCEKAIKSLSQAFAGEKETMIPQAAEIIERNLAVIDATIQACREAVRKEPDDLQARSYLLAAYMEKVSFLDSALELSRKNPSALTRGKSL